MIFSARVLLITVSESLIDWSTEYLSFEHVSLDFIDLTVFSNTFYNLNFNILGAKFYWLLPTFDIESILCS